MSNEVESAEAVTPPYAEPVGENEDKKENIPEPKVEDDRWEFHAAKFRDFNAHDNTMNQTSATDFFNNTNGLGSPAFYEERRRKEQKEQEKNKRRSQVSTRATASRSRSSTSETAASSSKTAPVPRGITPTRTLKPPAAAVVPAPAVVKKVSIGKKPEFKTPVPVGPQKPTTRSMTQEARRRSSFMDPTEGSRRRASSVAMSARRTPQPAAKPAAKPVAKPVAKPAVVKAASKPPTPAVTRASKPPVVAAPAVVKRPPPVALKPKVPAKPVVAVLPKKPEEAAANPPVDSQPAARAVRERRCSFMEPTQASRRRSVIPAPVAKETKPKGKL